MNEPGAGHTPRTIMLVVGEPSGDQLGAQLMAGLKEIAGDRVHIVGVGGSAMRAEGLQSLFPLDATSVMGLREVVPRIPAILKRVREAADFALRTRPDLVVIIDSPDFTHRIAQRLKRIDPAIRTANYVPPQVWASRSYRARKMASYIDAVLTLFPFEAVFFERYGIRAYSVGYPVIERANRMTGGAAFRQRRGISPDAPLLAVLPGSRRSEIRFILPTFKAAVAILARTIPGLVSVLPTTGHVADLVRASVADWPTPIHVVETDDEKFAAFDAADAALAASGTVTTELALAKTPMVVGYRIGWLTYALARPLMHVTHIVLINLVLGRKAVPEFIQGACTPEALAGALEPLLTDEPARAKQVRDLEEATRAFGLGQESPSLRAARVVLELAQGAPVGGA
ncbi:MAG TPA: lipid-A-disaccharide synthase [Micropepsaceae bacterium]|nr:lipid-A-disaccharide synthase [Micropepsaceae bacterium]